MGAFLLQAFHIQNAKRVLVMLCMCVCTVPTLVSLALFERGPVLDHASRRLVHSVASPRLNAKCSMEDPLVFASKMGRGEEVM